MWRGERGSRSGDGAEVWRGGERVEVGWGKKGLRTFTTWRVFPLHHKKQLPSDVIRGHAYIYKLSYNLCGGITALPPVMAGKGGAEAGVAVVYMVVLEMVLVIMVIVMGGDEAGDGSGQYGGDNHGWRCN